MNQICSPKLSLIGFFKVTWWWQHLFWPYSLKKKIRGKKIQQISEIEWGVKPLYILIPTPYRPSLLLHPLLLPIMTLSFQYTFSFRYSYIHIYVYMCSYCGAFIFIFCYIFPLFLSFLLLLLYYAIINMHVLYLMYIQLRLL